MLTIMRVSRKAGRLRPAAPGLGVPGALCVVINCCIDLRTCINQPVNRFFLI